MNISKSILALAAFGLLAACEIGPDKTYDRGIDKKHLSQLVAGVWSDPEGCDHWMIDDGVEGYLMSRLDKYGKPVCSGVSPPNVVTGPFKSGSPIPDIL